MVDWGIGRYEETAKELEPVAKVVVERAAPVQGVRALDLGCGSGNAALELARAGAAVTAVDPSLRLLDVARKRAEAEALEIDARAGEAAAIPLADDSIDVIVSVFAVIFAPDPRAALSDMARVLAPGGRILLTAWVPGIGIGKAYARLGAYLGQKLGGPPPAPPFPWHEEAALSELAEPLGLSLSVEPGSIAFRAASPEAQVELDATTHPMSIDAIARVRDAGGDEAELRAEVIAAMHEINEDASAFQATSRYVIATLRWT
jgi:SAM-dependent methyltransferase